MTASDADGDGDGGARSGSVPDPHADAAERARLAGVLAGLRLPPAEWDAIGAALDDVAREDADALARLSQLVFEATVAQRFRAGRARTTLPPTKQVSALPWVGLACGALVLAVGGALGGGVVLVGVAVLSVGVFAVAFAGSRVAHGNGRTRSDTATSDDDGDATRSSGPMPASVADRAERMLDSGR